MFITKILKKLIIVTISFCFLFTFCFITACRGPEDAEIVETTEEIAEEVEEPAEEEAAEPEVEVEEAIEEEAPPAVEVSGYEIGEEIMVYDSSTSDPICSLIIHSVENFTQEGHTPQASSLWRSAQARYWAMARARLRFPDPGGPNNIRAWGVRSSATRFRSLRFTSCCPMISLNNIAFWKCKCN